MKMYFKPSNVQKYLKPELPHFGEKLADVKKYLSLFTLQKMFFPVVEVPTVRVDPERQTVGTGQTTTIRCIVTGNPQPVITWSKQSGELDDNFQVRPSDQISGVLGFYLLDGPALVLLRVFCMHGYVKKCTPLDLCLRPNLVEPFLRWKLSTPIVL